MAVKALNPRKTLRIQCSSCGTGNELQRTTCRKCDAALPEGLGEFAITEAQGIEDALKEAEEGNKAEPYAPFDKAKRHRDRLAAKGGILGLESYLENVRMRLRPAHVAIHAATLRANLVLLAILVGLALVPLIMGWKPMVTLIMLLPAGLWLGVTLKAFLNLSKAKRGI